MAYSSGFLKDRITVLNRKKAQQGKFGLDSAGIEWEPTACLWASVDWQRGKAALSVGALDAYGVILVRTRWTNQVTIRSRIQHEGQTYQVLPETLHADQRANTLQFMAQIIINEQ